MLRLSRFQRFLANGASFVQQIVPFNVFQLDLAFG